MGLASPSGRFAIRAHAEVERRDGAELSYVRLAVEDDRSGGTTLLSERHAGWFSLDAGWDERDRLWVRSGDTGTSVYEVDGDGWRRLVWMADGPAEPDPARSVYDVESGRDLPVVGGPPPPLTDVRP